MDLRIAMDGNDLFIVDGEECSITIFNNIVFLRMRIFAY